MTIPALQVNALKFCGSRTWCIKTRCNSSRQWMEISKLSKTGEAFDKFKDAKYKFKLAIRKKRERDSDDFSDSLYESLLKKNINFWKIWRNKITKRHSLPSNISDLTNPAEIADGFGNYFSSLCSPNSDIAYEAETKFQQALDCNKEIIFLSVLVSLLRILMTLSLTWTW